MPLIRPGGTPPRTPQGDAHAALASDDADERWRAARQLGGSPHAVDALRAALAVEREPRVREAIFTSLARLQAVEAVLPSLRSDDANLRSGALDAMRAMLPAVRPHLPGLLADPDRDVRLLICELARHLPGDDATALLCAVIERDEDANVCAAAIDVLAEVGEPAAIAALEACAARFAGRDFLAFAIRIAIDRIRTQQDAADG